MLKFETIENVSKDALLEYLSRNEDILKAIKNVTNNHPEYSNELLQELFICLITMDEPKLLRMYNDGELESYIVGTVKMMYHKSKSSFYKKIILPSKMFGNSTRLDHITNVNYETKDLIESIPDAPSLALPNNTNRSTNSIHQYTEELEIGLQKLKPYYQQVIMLYLKYGSIAKIVSYMESYAGYPISKESVRLVFNNAKKELRSHIKTGIAPLFEENFHNY